MIHTGLLSITFRKLSPERIIELVAKAGMAGIEWGGDIHVPHGDLARARQVSRWTEDAGLTVASYGSYFRVGHEEPAPFEAVLDTAVELGAPIVRVWAGKHGSAQADAAYRQLVVEDSRRIANLAQKAGLRVAFEFHGNTLTDTNESALHLLQQVAHGSIACYWQPITAPPLPTGEDEAYRLQGLRAILPWLAHVHTFHWRADGMRCPLAEGHALWRNRLAVVEQTGRNHHALIEFVQDDSTAAFLRDASALKDWLA